MGEYRATQDAETAHPIRYRGQDNLPALSDCPPPLSRHPKGGSTPGMGRGGVSFASGGRDKDRERWTETEKGRERWGRGEREGREGDWGTESFLSGCALGVPTHTHRSSLPTDTRPLTL